MTSLTKNLQPPGTKLFSSADEKNGRPVCALEQLSSAIGREAMALVKQLKIASFRPISKYKHIVPRFQPQTSSFQLPHLRLGQSISLKFSLETRLESKSFEPLIISGSKVMI